MHPYLKQYIETLMCGCLLKHTAIFCSAAQFASQWKAVTGGGTLSLFHCLSKSPQCSKPAGCTLMIRFPLQRWDFFKLFFFFFWVPADASRGNREGVALMGFIHNGSLMRILLRSAGWRSQRRLRHTLSCCSSPSFSASKRCF